MNTGKTAGLQAVNMGRIREVQIE